VAEYGLDEQIEDNGWEEEASTCHTCQRSLRKHKDVLMLEWGEGDSRGLLRHGDSEVRFFCSADCLVQNFGYNPKVSRFTTDRGKLP